MLRSRVITSLILLPLTIWFIIAASNPLFMVVSALVLLVAAYEWANLIGLTKFWQQLSFIILILLMMVLSLTMSPTTVFITALFWWFLAFIWILLYPFAVFAWNKLFLLVILGVEVLMPCWLALNKIRIDYGYAILLYFFCLIWAADVGAYFVGRSMGKHKLAPSVSPGKTTEGVVGGLILAMGVSIAGMYYFNLSKLSSLLWFSLAILSVLVSVIGDLLESMLKRNRGVKDSGQLLPGHGGLLDRIDSITSAAPFFALGLIVFKQSLGF